MDVILTSVHALHHNIAFTNLYSFVLFKFYIVVSLEFQGQVISTHFLSLFTTSFLLVIIFFFLVLFVIHFFFPLTLGLPILFYVLDKDVPDSTVFRFPRLYLFSQHGSGFNKKTMLYWMVRAFVQAAISFLLTVLAWTSVKTIFLLFFCSHCLFL